MKQLILGLPLTLALLTACGGTDTPAGTTQPTTINGTVTGYTGGAASIDLKDNANASFSANATIASGSVTSSGTFTLTLPSSAAVSPYLSATKESDFLPSSGYTCTGSFTNSNPASRTFGTAILYIGTAPYSTYQMNYDSAAQTATGSAYLWIYTDQATTFGGTKTCTGTTANGYSSTINLTFTVPQKVGWNLIREDVTAAGDNTKKTVSSRVSFTTVNDQATVWKAQATAQSLGLKNAPAVVSTVGHAFNLR